MQARFAEVLAWLVVIVGGTIWVGELVLMVSKVVVMVEVASGVVAMG